MVVSTTEFYIVFFLIVINGKQKATSKLERNERGCGKMVKKIVLTGGPGTGKSAILLALENKGNYIVREAAEDWIKLRQAQGQPMPWVESDFQEQILELQLVRELLIPEQAKRAFIDRGVADGLAYATPGTKTYQEILGATKIMKYDQVYLIENLGFTEKTGVRRENNQEAIEIGNRLEQVYRSLGYNPIRIPAGPLEQRINHIIETLE